MGTLNSVVNGRHSTKLGCRQKTDARIWQTPIFTTFTFTGKYQQELTSPTYSSNLPKEHLNQTKFYSTSNSNQVSTAQIQYNLSCTAQIQVKLKSKGLQLFFLLCNTNTIQIQLGDLVYTFVLHILLYPYTFAVPPKNIKGLGCWVQHLNGTIFVVNIHIQHSTTNSK